LIEDDVPAKAGHFGRSDESLINQIEGRLIATSGNFVQRLWAALGPRSFAWRSQLRRPPVVHERGATR